MPRCLLQAPATWVHELLCHAMLRAACLQVGIIRIPSRFPVAGEAPPSGAKAPNDYVYVKRSDGLGQGEPGWQTHLEARCKHALPLQQRPVPGSQPMAKPLLPLLQVPSRWWLTPPRPTAPSKCPTTRCSLEAGRTTRPATPGDSGGASGHADGPTWCANAFAAAAHIGASPAPPLP